MMGLITIIYEMKIADSKDNVNNVEYITVVNRGLERERERYLALQNLIPGAFIIFMNTVLFYLLLKDRNLSALVKPSVLIIIMHI